MGKNWDYKNELAHEYKKNLAEFIQNNIFKPIQNKSGYVSQFHEWQRQKREKQAMKDYGGHSYQWFYIKYASEILGDEDLYPLSIQSRIEIEKLNISFFENKWKAMYREQVSLWLNNEEGSNEITTYKNFSSRFLDYTTFDEIKIY